MKYIFLLLLLFFSATGISQSVQDFSLVNVADGKNISLYGFKNCQGVAAIFTSNECAFDIQYRERIKALNEQYKGTIQFLLINSHLDPKENAKAMAQKYSAWSLPIPYLADKEQTAMQCLGAKRSPEVFLLKRTDSNFNIIYQGAIDDNPLVNTDVNNSYLKIAIDQLLANARIETSTSRPTGCLIRRK